MINLPAQVRAERDLPELERAISWDPSTMDIVMEYRRSDHTLVSQVRMTDWEYRDMVSRWKAAGATIPWE